jgi:2-oxoacid dehydrogenases acyltransferase (catalytic domain)
VPYTDATPRVVPGGKADRLAPPLRSGHRDKVALMTWRNSVDARIGFTIKLEWDRVVSAHQHIAPVAVIGYALAQALRTNPGANRRVALWGLRAHKTIRLSFAVDAGSTLQIAIVDRAERFSSREFQHELIAATRIARSMASPVARATRLVEAMPVVIGRPVLRLWSFLTAGLGVRMLGVDAAPFGMALISSIERFGLPAADVPFVPFARCALTCSVGAVSPSVIVRGGAPAVVDTVDVAVSFDHRICDAGQLASLLQNFEAACYSASSTCA